MIAIDANVLLRYLLDDDSTQSPLAAALIQGGETVLLTDVVLVETVWTLKGKKYRINKDGIIRVLNSLFEEPQIRFEDDQTVWRALQDYLKCKPLQAAGNRKGADFPDALVVNKAQHHARSKGETLRAVYTFDTAALALSGTRAP